MAHSTRLAAHRSRAADEVDDNKIQNRAGDQDEKEKSKQKDDDMSNEASAEALATAKTEGRDEGFTAANERMNKVFASEHYAGREALAAKMLGKASMTAEDIIDVLGSTPKAPAASDKTDEELKADAEKAGREEMRSAIEETGNSDIDADTGGKGGGPSAKTKNFGWDDIHADVEARRAASA